MRRKRTRNRLSVRAISGTYVVLLGIDLPKEDCQGLRGFAIHRTDHIEDESYYLRGIKTFADTDPGFVPGSTYSTRQHPIQGFSWSDYTAKPGHRYTYRIEALFGPPDALTAERTVSVEIETESPDDGEQTVYFNRGVAASQAYARRFGNRPPDEVGQPAFDWLSRGLYEATVAFIEEAANADYGLRVAAYEFHYEPILTVLKAALDRGVDLEIVYDARKEAPGNKNASAVAAAGLEDVCHPRETHPSYISHNKFIVRTRNGNPEAVLTGGTNFSEGGIFGHSNVSHTVSSHAVAAQYLAYWELLRQDLTNRVLKPQIVAARDIPRGLPPVGTTTVFSPRQSLDALDWYAKLAREANDSLFATFAFGMHASLQDAYQNSDAELRYAVMEKKTRPMARGPARDAEEAKIDALRGMKANRFAIGSKLNTGRFDRWLAERNSNLNRNVRYIHNKFMLIDPLSSSPVVITGSANFSKASSINNDENMLVVRDNNRVADMYLGEFMRLYSHHAFREFLERTHGNVQGIKHLALDDWWEDYFGDSARSRQRRLFADSDRV